MAIEAAVSHSVVQTPCTTGSVNAFWDWNCHAQFGFVRTLLTAIATSTAMTATATHRPGCRTGTALIGAGRVSRSVRQRVCS